MSLFQINPLPVPPKSDRLKCGCCGKIKSIRIEREETKLSFAEMIKRKREKAIGWRYLPIGLGYFCTNKCAVNYANRCYEKK